MTTDYIIPTKKSPVFSAYCSDFGRIETTTYKMWNIRKEGIINSVGNTFATNFMDSVNRLHEWIKENHEYVNELSGKIVFSIECIDGSFDKYGDVIHTTVYRITSAKAKKYLLK